MEEINFREVMYGLGIAMASFFTAWGVRSGVKKSDGKPPDEREPSMSEMRAKLIEIGVSLGEIKVYLDTADDRTEHRDRELSKQINDSFHQLVRQLDRIEYKRDQR